VDKQVPAEETYDNGGAIAIKGYNFQHAIASLIIILNYKKDDFCIYFETKDDVEVSLENKHIFIQVKGQKLSINDLTKPEKNNNKSILLKNISKNSSKKARYKVVALDFAEKDKKELSINQESCLFGEINCYSEEQKQIIIEKLLQQGMTEAEIKEKLSSSYIYFSPFVNNAECAYTYLLGCMNQNEINVDSNRGQAVLNELLKMITQKAEKVINNEQEKEIKKLESRELRKLFKSSECFNNRVKLANELKNADILNLKDYFKIKKELLDVDIKHRALKNEIENTGVIDFIETDKNEITAIHELYREIAKIKPQHNKALLYALSIDLYIDKVISEVEDESNDN